MVIFTSRSGNFEVEAISFSPNVITTGEETSYSISIKNKSGQNIKKLIMYLQMVYKDKEGNVCQSFENIVFGQYPLESSPGYWNNGQTVTFTGKYKFEPYYDPDDSTRVLPIYKADEMGYAPEGDESDISLMLHIAADAPFNNDSFYNVRGANSEYLTVLDSWYKPSIRRFVAERSNGKTPDDEGENLISTMRLSLSRTAFPERTRLLLKYRNKSGASAAFAEKDISNLINEALEGNTSADFDETFEKNADWEVELWFGDEYESATTAIVVPKSFVNVHLSGAANGGVCFGGFSQSTDEKPMFQCYYPATFYEGIEGISRYSTDEVAIGRWIDGKHIFRRVLAGSIDAGGTKTFEAIPDMETLVGISGMMKWTASNVWVPLVYSAGNTTYNAVSADANGKVSITGVNASTFFVIVDYTKTVEVVNE